MRSITTHHCPEAPAPITITADDLNETNKASHDYLIEVNAEGNLEAPIIQFALRFQKGVIANGWNGITDEALLAIVIDRLTCHFEGPWPNKFTGAALDFCNMAMEALHERKRERAGRGVQGEHKA